ncbi:MAG: DUF1559 domain-containing protein [Singulisphaera sp.]
MKQINLALHNYNDAFGLPYAGLQPHHGWGWLPMILPQLEQNNVYNAVASRQPVCLSIGRPEHRDHLALSVRNPSCTRTARCRTPCRGGRFDNPGVGYNGMMVRYVGGYGDGYKQAGPQYDGRGGDRRLWRL